MMRQIQKGKCIACTHELFRRLCLIKSFWTLLEGKGYTLIIDEELPIIRDYQFSRCTFRDMKFYLMRPFEGEESIVSVEEDGLLSWNSKARDAGNGAFHRLKKDIRSNCLCLEGGRVKWRIPLQNFAVFSKVYLMTYRFEGSIFHRRWESVMGADSVRYCHFEDNDIVEGKWQIPQERVDNLRRRLKIAGPSAYPSDVGKRVITVTVWSGIRVLQGQILKALLRRCSTSLNTVQQGRGWTERRSCGQSSRPIEK